MESEGQREKKNGEREKRRELGNRAKVSLQTRAGLLFWILWLLQYRSFKPLQPARRSPLDTTFTRRSLFSRTTTKPLHVDSYGYCNLDHLLDAFQRRHASSALSMPQSIQSRIKERGRSPGWLRRMHRNSSPSQRSASPAQSRDSSPRVRAHHHPPQVDGASSSTPEPAPKLQDSPIMPAFLKLTQDGKIVLSPCHLGLILIFECKKYLIGLWNLFALRVNA